jgi:hypothetical protein
MTDASFSDAAEQPLRLMAHGADDLPVLSALVQDGVARVGDIAWMKGRRRAALFLNRCRWEDEADAKAQGRPFERVRAVLLVEHVTAVRASGIDPADVERIVSVLSLGWTATSADPEDPSGTLHIALAGGADLAIDAEYLDLRLEDVTRPYAANSGKAPRHDVD